MKCVCVRWYVSCVYEFCIIFMCVCITYIACSAAIYSVLSRIAVAPQVQTVHFILDCDFACRPRSGPPEDTHAAPRGARNFAWARPGRGPEVLGQVSAMRNKAQCEPGKQEQSVLDGLCVAQIQQSCQKKWKA